jgi:hypothetical protein
MGRGVQDNCEQLSCNIPAGHTVDYRLNCGMLNKRRGGENRGFANEK